MSLEKLYELCRLLLPEDPSLEEEVRYLVVEDTNLHWIKTRFSVGKQHPRFPWFALVQALYKRELMFDLSTRFIAEQVSFYERKLGRKDWRLRGICEKGSFHDYVDTFLLIMGKHLLELGYVVAEFPLLDEQSSSIAMIHQNSSQDCVRLAKQSGYGEIILHPSQCHHRRIAANLESGE